MDEDVPMAGQVIIPDTPPVIVNHHFNFHSDGSLGKDGRLEISECIC